jgi:hypothetical protein
MAEGVSLEFIGAQLAKVLEGQRETNERFDKIDAAMAELQVSLATTRADLGIVKASVFELQESAQIIEHDISGIRMRVERIERHTGLVKA